MNEIRPRQCSGCRRDKVLVAHACGMGYCENCKHKVPTRRQFADFVNEKLQNIHYNEDFKAKPVLKHRSQGIRDT